MSLLQIKKDYEQYLYDNYTETEIHWSGTKFSTEGKSEWIYFEYVGQSVGDCGFDNTKYNHKGFLEITVIAKTRFRVNDIADIVISLFKNKEISNSFARSTKIVNTGIIEDIDRSYMDLAIEINMV